MAVSNVPTFWSAFIAVLLKCIAALGFATPARTQAVAAAPTAAPAPAPMPAGRTAIPSPRTFEPPYERSGRSLPPTMKQRIRAEAHGASPSARSVTGDIGADAPPCAPDSAARAALSGTVSAAGSAATAGTTGTAGTAGTVDTAGPAATAGRANTAGPAAGTSPQVAIPAARRRESALQR